MNRTTLILILCAFLIATTANARGTGDNGANNASLPNTGKVLEVINAAGYTYLHVEDKDKQVWIAAKEQEVKAGDIVNYSQGSVMRDFHSKTLNRTFPEIIFTSAVQLEQTTAVANASQQAIITEGQVISTMDSGGYTYIEAKQGDENVWLAAPKTTVKQGDAIRYINDGSGMKDFYSKTLDRKFAEILFVGEVQVTQQP